MDALRSRTRIPIVLLLLYVAVYAILVAFRPLPGDQAILDVMDVGIGLAAAALCGLAALKAGERFLKWFWGLFALANLCSAIAEAVWAVYELLLHVDAPYPSLADAAWLAFYPLAFAGFMRLTTTRTRRRMVEAVSTLDALLFSVAGAGLAWDFLMVPALDPQATSLANLTAVAYPIGDLLLIGALASLAFSGARRSIPRGTSLVIVSLLVTLVADVIYMRMVNAGTYQTGAWVDPLWPLSYALFGVAALVFMGARAKGQTVTFESQSTVVGRGRGRRSAELLRRYVPYVAVLIAAFLSYNHFVLRGGSGPGEDVVMIVITSLIPILLLSRQLLMSIENRRLHTSLVEASHVLEARVVERTEQLAAEKDRLHLLNQAATEISRCTTVREVLDAGARLLARASGREAVGVAARDQQGVFHFSANSGLTESAQRALKKITRRFLDSTTDIVDSDPVPATLPARGKPALTNLPEELGSVRMFPMISKRAMLGVACVSCEQDDTGLSDDETGLAWNIATQLAVALEGARRYDDARFMADNDALTGLSNRRSITDRLDQEVARSGRAQAYFSLIMMDVDNFKQVNDTYGHLVGDQALIATSAALKLGVRTGDTVGRLGGDEFLAILPDTGSAGALQVVERIRKHLADQPLSVNGGVPLPIQVSCGIAVFPVHGRDAEELLRVADENMYFFKRHGDKRIGSSHEDEPPPVISETAFSMLDGLINSIEERDDYTRRHSDEVAKYAAALAGRLGLSPLEVRSARMAGLLHDVGKISVPGRLLRKSGPLTEDEYEVVRQHSQVGQLIVNEVPSLHHLSDGVAGHHERYDGQGYPRGLKGEDIPMQARILAVADAYVAMTSERPYRRALGPDEARAELRQVSGTQLDPVVVEELLALLDGSGLPEESAVGAAAATTEP